MPGYRTTPNLDTDAIEARRKKGAATPPSMVEIGQIILYRAVQMKDLERSGAKLTPVQRAFARLADNMPESEIAEARATGEAMIRNGIIRELKPKEAI